MRKIYRVCICGCRHFDDYDFFKEKCLYLLKEQLPKVIVISGGAKGVDALAERFAKELGLQNEIYKADWKRYARAAGPKRNEEMVKSADGVIAFWNFKSRGTNTTINFAKKHKIYCSVVEIE